MSTVAADDHHDHQESPYSIKRWLFTTNHKDIGTLYLWFSFIMFLIGGVMALIIRTELFEPGLQFVDPAQVETRWLRCGVPYCILLPEKHIATDAGL